MDIVYLIITGLSVLGSVLAWLAKLRWSEEYAKAKDETIKAKEAQLGLLQEQLRTKDQIIAAKDSEILQRDSQIKLYQDLNPKVLSEYNETIKKSLEQYIEKLKNDLHTAEQNLALTNEKLETSASASKNNEITIDALEDEKAKLTLQITELQKQIEVGQGFILLFFTYYDKIKNLPAIQEVNNIRRVKFL